MRYVFFVIFLLISSTIFSQINKDTSSYKLSPVTLESFRYNAPKHKSPKFKVTLRTAFNREVIGDKNLSEILEEVEFFQFAKYNLRARWKLKNKNKVFIGAQTLGFTTGLSNVYYIGFKKYF
jgi:hypothetical protein